MRSGNRLGPRLEAVAALVPRGARVADVGSGHGLLAAGLLERGTAAACIATERDERLLRELREARPAPLPPGLELRWGDGLAPLEPGDRIDVVVLAGMGARTIRGLLSDPRLALLGVRRLVLQPQTEHAALRRTLAMRGLGIVDERMARERGRYYVAIAAEPGVDPPAPHPTLSDDDLLVAGPSLVRRGGPVMREFWTAQLGRAEAIARRAAGAASRERARTRVLRARRVLAAIRL